MALYSLMCASCGQPVAEPVYEGDDRHPVHAGCVLERARARGCVCAVCARPLRLGGSVVFQTDRPVHTLCLAVAPRRGARRHRVAPPARI
jgi:hypothetical protein